MGPRRPGVLAALGVLLVMRAAAPAAAQTVEVAPVAGYGFGGDLFELATNHPLDIDGSPVFGGAVSVEMDNGLWFEALFTHQQADLDLSAGPYGPPGRIRAVVNHFLAGGRQDFGTGRARPFVTGLVGLTHYGAEGDDEIRFTLGPAAASRWRSRRTWICASMAGCTRTFVDVDAAARCSGAASSA
jgi:hypothetical protein